MELLGLIGYGLSSLAYLIFFLLSMASRQQSLSGTLTRVLGIILCVCACMSVWQLYQGFSLVYVLYMEALKSILITLLILGVKLRASSFSNLLKQKEVHHFLIAVVLLALLSGVSIVNQQNFTWVFISFMALNLWPLVLLEQVFRNAQKRARWAVWPMVFGLGSMLVFDFVIFAQGALINQLDFNFWYLRGYLSAAMMPFILLSSKRIKNWSSDLFISRDIVFYSSILVLSGVYLLLLAFAGYVIRFLDGQWSELLSVAFMCLGLLVLFAVLLTQNLRNKIRVFISKHFFANRYDYRLEWLNLIAAIERSHSEDIYENASSALSEVLQLDGCIYLQLNNVNRFEVMNYGQLKPGMASMGQLDSLVDYFQQQAWIIDLSEVKSSPETYKGLEIDHICLLNDNIEILVPVFFQQHLTGVFAMTRPANKGVLNWEDRDFLFALTKQLGNYLSLQEAQKQLTQTQQFAVFHRMSAFVLHDLKNIQAQLGLITANAERHKNNPEFISDVFATVESASSRLQKVVRQLANKSLEKIKEPKQQVNVQALLVESVKLANVHKPQVKMECEADLYVYADKERFAGVLMHLIENAQQASKPDDHVQLIGKKQENRLILSIRDRGCGMTQAFIRDKLFTPFSTTKGNAGMGIGVYEARQFFEENSGVMSVQSEVDKGTTFTIEMSLSEYQEIGYNNHGKIINC
ncbi:XrtA/PEP-CTERM system histidine kinase PrsK [Thalassotalea sp. PS06]|uniref:XrtA/PEP-CTERM system histidine kinase PrsK n=1 Tax=Thalassotalea sp. PS06 TaxID=2594005 RepID=UPI0011656E73|nr:XrtA/PEP-CTERM system histidine kinase PrsK [Thalassotalea sp. PS06]QDO99961.1 PEP-CTERM system histidine kinase PrsK [Thalassotalea sp. PS06]